ncbi:MAG: hypothetical protein AAF573_06520 [Bacteroidota bacterium]
MSILDEPFIREESLKNLKSTIHWWERKRLLFNICIVVAATLPTIYFQDLILYQRPTGLIILVIIYMLFANLFFSIGWGIDALRYHFFSGKNFGKYKEVFFLLGLFFSIGMTLLLSILFWITFTIPLYQ